MICNIVKGKVLYMDKKIIFTQKELQLLYAACMSYGDKLSDISKKIPNESESVLYSLSVRAEESWNLAKKIIECLNNRDKEKEKVCPHCMEENIILWNDEKNGYEVICLHCGEKIMLRDLDAIENKQEGKKNL